MRKSLGVALRVSLGFVLLTSLLRVSVPTANAFDIDMHYDVTFKLAVAKGWDWSEAGVIASADFAIDRNVSTVAKLLVGSKQVYDIDGYHLEDSHGRESEGLVSQAPENYELHCFSQSPDSPGQRNPDVLNQMQNLQDKAEAALTSYRNAEKAANGRFSPALFKAKQQALIAVGVYLHCQEDSWSHSGVGGSSTGHLVPNLPEVICSKILPDCLFGTFGVASDWDRPDVRPGMTAGAIREKVGKLDRFLDFMDGTPGHTDPHPAFRDPADADPLIAAITDRRLNDLPVDAERRCVVALAERWLYQVLQAQGRLGEVPFTNAVVDFRPDPPCDAIGQSAFPVGSEAKLVKDPQPIYPYLDEHGEVPANHWDELGMFDILNDTTSQWSPYTTTREPLTPFGPPPTVTRTPTRSPTATVSPTLIRNVYVGGSGGHLPTQTSAPTTIPGSATPTPTLTQTSVATPTPTLTQTPPPIASGTPSPTSIAPQTTPTAGTVPFTPTAPPTTSAVPTASAATSPSVTVTTTATTTRTATPTGTNTPTLTATATRTPNPATATATQLPANGTLEFNGITVGTDNALWVTEQATSRIGRLTTGGSFSDFPIPSGNVQPFGIARGSDGALWFTEPGINSIGRLTTSGTFTGFTIPTGNSQPRSIVSGPDGALYFTENGANQIGRLTTGGVFTEFAIPTANSQPEGITVDANGTLWFTEMGANQVGKLIVGPTGPSFTEIPLLTPFAAPFDLAFGSDTNLYVTESAAGKVAQFRPSDLGIAEFSIPAPNSVPHGITGGPDGNLWFTEFGSNRIGRMSTAGSFTEFTIPTPNSQPQFIVPGPDGNLWFTEFNGNNVSRITTVGIIVEF